MLNVTRSVTQKLPWRCLRKFHRAAAAPHSSLRSATGAPRWEPNDRKRVRSRRVGHSIARACGRSFLRRWEPNDRKRDESLIVKNMFGSATLLRNFRGAAYGSSDTFVIGNFVGPTGASFASAAAREDLAFEYPARAPLVAIEHGLLCTTGTCQTNKVCSETKGFHFGSQSV